MICPKCGFNQPDDYYCANCGVNIERFARRKKSKRHFITIITAFLGIVTISVVAYLYTSEKPERAERAGKSKDDLSRLTLKQEQPTKSKVGPSVSSPAPDAGSKARGRPAARQPKGTSTERQVAERDAGKRPSDKPQLEGVDEVADPQANGTKQTAEQWFTKGRELDDDSEEEITFYRNAIVADLKFAPAYYHLGAIYYRQADYELAEQEFARFLKYASEEERGEYDIYLYYSSAEVERLVEVGRAAESEDKEAEEGVTPEAATPESGDIEVEEEGAAAQEDTEEAEEEVQTIVRFTALNDQIVVPVVLNGSVTANVLLDTGSGITIVSREIARSLGLEVAKSRMIHLKTIAAGVRAPLARLDSIQLGNLSSNNFPVAVADLDLGEQSKFDGILGMDFLKRYSVHIDNEHERILLSPGTEPRYN